MARSFRTGIARGWYHVMTGLAFSTITWVMTPLTSALISFMTFIASMMQTTVSGPTSVPTSQQLPASGDGAR